ncbi:MAG: glycosyltransferase [Bacteroidota bacterium]
MVTSIYLLFSILLSVGYVAIMWQYIQGWKELPTWEIPKNYTPKTTISVLIPARNEGENIANCLNAVLEQDYPDHLYEVIVLDDFSEDDTADWVRLFQVQCCPQVQLIELRDHIRADETQSFKKKALEIGIQKAMGELIVTTDADCVVQPQWLSLIASFYEITDAKFIAAPVNFYQEKSSLERFQSLDFMGMMGIAGGGIQRNFMRMCNGANLAYPKAVFEAVLGFEGIDKLASGDDMLLMQKVAAQYPDGIGYLKSRAATTFTRAKPDIRSFLNQRIRWSTKSSSYREHLVTLILAMVFFFCCNILLCAFLALFVPLLWYVLLGLFAVKAIMDYWLLKQMSTFFQRRDLMRSFLPAFFMHTIYIAIVGVLANLKTTYEWKGREVR